MTPSMFLALKTALNNFAAEILMYIPVLGERVPWGEWALPESVGGGGGGAFPESVCIGGGGGGGVPGVCGGFPP